MQYTTLAVDMIEGSKPTATAAQKAASNAAGRQIAGMAQRIARSIHGRYCFLSKQRYRDYLDDAPDKAVLAVLGGFGRCYQGHQANLKCGDDPVCGFVYTTLERHYHTFGRQAKRAARQLSPGAHGDAHADPLDRFPARNHGAPDGVSELISRDCTNSPFSPTDLATIADWKPADALVLLGVSGLARKLSRPQWENLLKASGVASTDMGCDFSDPESGRERLAALMGVKRNTIDQRWHRSCELFMQLQFVRDLADELPRRLVA